MSFFSSIVVLVCTSIVCIILLFYYRTIIVLFDTLNLLKLPTKLTSDLFKKFEEHLLIILSWGLSKCFGSS